ncbi:MAG: CHAP domain-containing protein [Proteobacteria bacterium]|nr:CHAP domain-containing protein [Pseudomonadota bacterium]
MVGLERFRAVRAFGFGLAAALLAACASMPAPVSVLGEGAPQPSVSAPSYNPGAAPRVVDRRAHLQCVPYAREASGIQIFGDANTWWGQAAGRYPRSNSPASGSVLVMRGYSDPGRGHVAVVTQVVSSRLILVNHANWLNHGEISTNVPIADVSPGNDWSEVRVWYIPTGQWGARVYQAHGFIHPFLLAAAIG